MPVKFTLSALATTLILSATPPASPEFARSVAEPREARTESATRLVPNAHQDRVLVVNVTGTAYTSDVLNIWQTLVDAGVDATFLALQPGSQEAAEIILNGGFDQIWLADYSMGQDNDPNVVTGLEAVANWFNADPSRGIICDPRMIASYWQGRWPDGGKGLSENYFSHLQFVGGGLVLATDHTPFHQNGINSVNGLVGLDWFWGTFSATYLSIDPSSPLMSFPNQLGDDGPGGDLLWNDNSPGASPQGVQPSGRLLFPIGYHNNNLNTPAITTTIGEIDATAAIEAPLDGSSFSESDTIVFEALVSGPDEDAVIWSTTLDTVPFILGAGNPLSFSGLAGSDEGTPYIIEARVANTAGVSPPASVTIVVTTDTDGCGGDVDGNGAIDLADLNLVLANFGSTTSDGDANGDGEVNLADLNAVLAAFGQSCD